MQVDDIIATIKSADSRVKDFIIDDPTYYTDVMYADNSQLNLMRSYSDPVSNVRLEDLQIEIIARNILAGVTPLFLFDTDTTYSYTMKPVGSYNLITTGNPNSHQIKYDESTESLILNSNPAPNINDPVKESYKDISAITSQVDVPLDWSRQTVKIGNSVYDITVRRDITDGIIGARPEVSCSDSSFDSSETWEWKTVPKYSAGDVVIYGDEVWVCNDESYGTSPSNISWTQVDEYSTTADYDEGKFVKKLNESKELEVYKCLKSVKNDLGISITNSAYWQQVEILELIISPDLSDLTVRSASDKNIVSKAAGYKLKTNETVFMYAPSYISKAQMSTYLNICIKDTNTTNPIERIPANSLYQLKPGQTLYVSETVFDKNQSSLNIFATNTKYLPTSAADIDNIKNKQGKAYRVYEAGTIIKPSFDMTNGIKGGIQITSSTELDNYINLESDKTIDIMEANTTKINKKSSDSADVATKQVYCAWITDDLNNKLFSSADELAATGSNYIEHILQQNELFMYTDATKSDLVILQSGTRLKIPYSSTSFNSEYWMMEKPSQSEINQNGLDALDNYWREIPRSLTYFEVEELEI